MMDVKSELLREVESTSALENPEHQEIWKVLVSYRFIGVGRNIEVYFDKLYRRFMGDGYTVDVVPCGFYSNVFSNVRRGGSIIHRFFKIVDHFHHKPRNWDWRGFSRLVSWCVFRKFLSPFSTRDLVERIREKYEEMHGFYRWKRENKKRQEPVYKNEGCREFLRKPEYLKWQVNYWHVEILDYNPNDFNINDLPEHLRAGEALFFIDRDGRAQTPRNEEDPASGVCGDAVMEVS
jgi:hypothetical protein